MIRIAVCEDNIKDLAHLLHMLGRTEILCDITKYEDAETMLHDVEICNRKFDLFLLDIYLPGMTGVEAARRIRAQNKNILLVFLTTSEDFYREAFDLYAFHYLIKPVQEASLSEVLQKASEIINSPAETLHISFGGEDIILRQQDISYVSSSNHILLFHMQDGTSHTSYGKLDEIQPLLSEHCFVRCHKSFIVNIRHVTKLTKEGFYIEDTLIPISRTYAASARESYKKLLFDVF